MIIMEKIFTDLFEGLIAVCIGAVSSIAIYYFRFAMEKLRERTKDEKVKNSLKIADDVVSTAVQSVTQTYVDGLKKKGAFNDKAQKEAFEKAKSIIDRMITDETKNIIDNNYSEFETWVDHKIEQKIGESKNTYYS